MTVRIRFPQGEFAALHTRLLSDPTQEAFALLFGQRHQLGDQTIIKIVAAAYPTVDDYRSQGLAHLRLKREYVYDRLIELQHRSDVDTIIDVHTHPFSPHGVAFSGVDDRDEIAFHQWLTETLDDVHYASIVLSQSDYAARLWTLDQYQQSYPQPAWVKTQTVPECWARSDDSDLSAAQQAALDPHDGFLARSVLALGLDHLRRIMHNQRIALIGVGGLGSVIAENLIHSGFQHLQLIDHDCVEITNLNRIVGAYASDAAAQRLKVDAVRDHLQRINPAAQIDTLPLRLEDPAVLPLLAQADWFIVTTDNHASRFKAQELALRLGIPLLAAGSNISVNDGQITDLSGEVIIARNGDRLCLNCLQRVAPTQIAAETIEGLGAELAQRGYVSGREVKEPAVKTLNAMLGALAVDALMNQYTERQPTIPVLVYENNDQPCLYPDTASVNERQRDCYHCA
ncbi:hypothetical protein CKO12_11690 [Chromatium okenii]|uniref:ThiF family adenylyltransferase n=1 Tax=Chromatium okenii TaxID=61644 RepID=UPI001904882E|nr:ThiF family adenylyltransferase [Chromatium okenii]MBK1642528.1 hypothetical protein [Chromatium okenii]